MQSKERQKKGEHARESLEYRGGKQIGERLRQIPKTDVSRECGEEQMDRAHASSKQDRDGNHEGQGAANEGGFGSEVRADFHAPSLTRWPVKSEFQANAAP